ncbi:hypothetical protein B0T13DRAFT_526035 [Neurospora crassa]|nr:hypothetical protein B0T13DRAFT_526035 [Neurospora crassa]
MNTIASVPTTTMPNIRRPITKYYLPVRNGVRTIPKGRTSSNHPRLQVSISGWLPHVPAALLRVDVKLSDQRVGSQLTKSTIPEATNPPLDVRERRVGLPSDSASP